MIYYQLKYCRNQSLRIGRDLDDSVRERIRVHVEIRVVQSPVR